MFAQMEPRKRITKNVRADANARLQKVGFASIEDMLIYQRQTKMTKFKLLAELNSRLPQGETKFSLAWFDRIVSS